MLDTGSSESLALIEWGALRFVVKFVIHIIVGTILFALVALVAIFLHRFMDWVLGSSPTVEYISAGVEGVEVFLFAVDLICLIAFVVKETIVLLRGLWLALRLDIIRGPGP
jgi:hypothetical protein